MPHKGDESRQKKGGGTSKSPNVLDLAKYEIVQRLTTFHGDLHEERKCLNEYFVEQALTLYPHLCMVTYQVPAVHFNKGKTTVKRPGKQKKLPEMPSQKFDYQERVAMNDGDARGDRAHATVVSALYDMSENLRVQGLCPLFIINSYHQDSYLQRLQENVPGNLKRWTQRGEMDMLVLKPRMLVFIEAKSTGDNVAEWGEGSADKLEAIGKKIKFAFNQLDHYEEVFDHCMEDSLKQAIVWRYRIAAFPNLKTEEAEDIINKRTDLFSQDDIKNKKYILLCSDVLKSVDSLTQWWLENIEGIDDISAGRQDQMVCLDDCECDQPYYVEGLKEMQIMIGRYLGGMSVVDIYKGPCCSSRCREVRRKGQSVNVTGQEFGKIILTKDQVNYVNNDVRLGYLNGPPGSGKTVVLAIRGRRWIIDEDDGITIILNMYRGSRGRSIGKQTRQIICQHQDKGTRKILTENCLEIAIDVDQFDEKERDEIKTEILKRCNGDSRKCLFLVDETYVKTYWQNVFNMLVEDFMDSHIWLAGLYGGKPDDFDNMTLTEVMRCPPNVQKVLYHVDWMNERKCSYKLDSTLADMPTDGADVMVLLHRYHHKPHLHPAQCLECGEDLVAFLEKSLDVKKPGSPRERPYDLQLNSLKCSDIVILVNLPRNLYTKDHNNFLDTNEHCYTEYMKLLESSSLVKTLIDNGFPTKVHTTLPCFELVAGSEEIIHVSWVFSYQGLENKVIIFLPAGPAMLKDSVLDKLPEDERAVWKDASKNIPCPGLMGRGSGQWNECVKYSSSVAFFNTVMEEAVDPNCECDNNTGPSVSGAEGEEYRERSLSLNQSKETIRKWKVEDLQRYNRWDKSTLFISASRCTAQLVLITP